MIVEKYTAKNTKQMAALYGISVKTFAKWIKPHLKIIGDKIGYTYTPKQVKAIFEALGEPD